MEGGSRPKVSQQLAISTPVVQGESVPYGFVTLESFQSAPEQWEGGNLCPFTSVEFDVLHFVHL